MNKLGKIFIIIGTIFITLSLTSIIYYNYKDYNAKKKSEEVLDIIKNNFEERKPTIINQEPIYDNSKEMQTVNINGYDYIGTITIPSLDLELPIISEYDYDKLNISPCRYYGSIYTNDLIICGHSYKSHFKYLANLNQEDIIIFTDITGNKYIYQVKVIEVLSPTDITEMIDNEFDLTLYTCTSDGLNRITIRCNRIYELS